MSKFCLAENCQKEINRRKYCTACQKKIERTNKKKATIKPIATKQKKQNTTIVQRKKVTELANTPSPPSQQETPLIDIEIVNKIIEYFINLRDKMQEQPQKQLVENEQYDSTDDEEQQQQQQQEEEEEMMEEEIFEKQAKKKMITNYVLPSDDEQEYEIRTYRSTMVNKKRKQKSNKKPKIKNKPKTPIIQTASKVTPLAEEQTIGNTVRNTDNIINQLQYHNRRLENWDD